MADLKLMRKEHETVRNNVGYYDFTHQLLEVTGKDAAKFLDNMFVNGIENIDVGKAVYTTMLNEDGIIIDDVIVFRLGDEKFWVSTLYIDDMIKWFDKHKKNETLNYVNITDNVTMFAIQGPKSRDLVNSIVENNVNDLQFFNIIGNKVKDLDIKVARAGFTGELGYEFYVDSSKKGLLEKEIVEKGKDFGLENITTDVIVGSLPAEKGYVLMSDLEGTNPLEVGYGWTVDWDSKFVGKDKLLKEKYNITRDLLGFTVNDDSTVASGDDIFARGEKVGKVTKFTYGFTVEKNIGYALIDITKVKIGDKVTIKTSNGDVEVILTNRVFYDEDDERVRA
ncbi:aminomethyltransferase [Peptoniphilus olsenii]|uniref:Aminomethyltransferase n=1 Tax=Peptoniphilus olsenii TaxID=411570 RepID=A0ABV2J8Z9_9FIRM